MRFHNIDGKQVQFTALEETARDAEESAANDPAKVTARVTALVDRDMASPLVQTILSNPPNPTAFRAALEANYRAKL